MKKREARIRQHFRNIVRGLKRRGACEYDANEASKLLRAITCLDACQLCFTSMRPLEISLDHATPIVRGGDHDKTNLLHCHSRCNKMKGQLTVSEWQRLRATILRFDFAARKDIERRLLAGGRIYGGR